MAKTVRDTKIESRTARMTLKVAGKPYYRSIDEGLHLGYRKGTRGGKWVIRRYVGDQAYKVEVIGTADDIMDADGNEVLTFAQAQAEARKRFIQERRRAAGLPAENGPYTVTSCMDDYVQWLEQNRKSAADTRARAEALILPTLGKTECAKLTTKQIRDWRDRMAENLPRLRTKKGKQQRHRELDEEDPEDAIRKRRASANRVLTILKAALNHAWREKKVSSDDAWRAVTGFREADAARIRFLTVEESQRLMNAAEPDFRNLIRAALSSGARFSELANLEVADFNPNAGTLHVRTSKSGKGRHIVLTEEGIEHFTTLTAGRGSREIILRKANASRWSKSHQSRPMAEACRNAQIDPPAGFHTLRHTYASLTIMNGAPLMVVAKNLGHVDTRMVEKHYGHLAPSFVADAIRAAAPRFGSVKSNVVSLP